LPVEALCKKPVDGVADASNHEQHECSLSAAGDKQPEHDGHEDSPSESDEIGYAQCGTRCGVGQGNHKVLQKRACRGLPISRSVAERAHFNYNHKAVLISDAPPGCRTSKPCFARTDARAWSPPG